MIHHISGEAWNHRPQTLLSKSTAILLLTKSQQRIVEDQGITRLWPNNHPYLSAASLVLLQGANFETNMETLSLPHLRTAAEAGQSHQTTEVTLTTLAHQS